MDRMKLELRLYEIAKAEPENRRALLLGRKLKKERHIAEKAAGLSKKQRRAINGAIHVGGVIRTPTTPVPRINVVPVVSLNSDNHTTGTSHNPQRYAHVKNQIEMLRDVIGRGGTVVAFDGEWPYHGQRRRIDEIGLSIFSPTGRTDDNFIIAYGAKVRKDRFPPGSTVFSPDQMAEHLTSVWAKADILLGHDLSEDFKKLRQMGFMKTHPSYFNTSSWCRYAFPDHHRHSLKHFVRLCEVPARTAHIAVNDSAMVLDCALSLLTRSLPCRDIVDPIGASDLVDDCHTCNEASC